MSSRILTDNYPCRSCGARVTLRANALNLAFYNCGNPECPSKEGKKRGGRHAFNAAKSQELIAQYGDKPNENQRPAKKPDEPRNEPSPSDRRPQPGPEPRASWRERLRAVWDNEDLDL